MLVHCTWAIPIVHCTIQDRDRSRSLTITIRSRWKITKKSMSKDHWHSPPCVVWARADGGAVWVESWWGESSQLRVQLPPGSRSHWTIIAQRLLSLVSSGGQARLVGRDPPRPSPCSLCLSYKAHEQLQTFIRFSNELQPARMKRSLRTSN